MNDVDEVKGLQVACVQCFKTLTDEFLGNGQVLQSFFRFGTELRIDVEPSVADLCSGAALKDLGKDHAVHDSIPTPHTEHLEFCARAVSLKCLQKVTADNV